MNTISSYLRMPSTRLILDYIYITIGLLMYGFGWAFFILPYNLVPGGLTGIASLIFYATGTIDVATTYFVVNVFLLMIALKILGFKFMTKTIYGIFMLSSILKVFQMLVTKEDGTMFRILGEHDILMSIIIGALICGTGLALIFLNNGSTGGTDIIAAIVNKYRDMSLGSVLLSADLVIMSSSYFVLHDFKIIIFGLVLMGMENYVLDTVMYKRNASVQFLIFSRDKHMEIAEEIGTKVERGITILDGHGWYSGDEMKVLCILAKKREQVPIFRIIKRIDPTAFISVGAVNGVYGEGFDHIKVKMKDGKKNNKKLRN